jgi:hypothetical protein
MNERLTLTSGRVRTGPNKIQEGLVVRFHLLCIVGLAIFIPTFSAQAEFVRMGLDSPANHAVLDLGTANHHEIKDTGSAAPTEFTGGNNSTVIGSKAFYEPSIETLFLGCIGGLAIIKLAAKIRQSRSSSANDRS